jgi:hypothetical protein
MLVRLYVGGRADTVDELLESIREIGIAFQWEILCPQRRKLVVCGEALGLHQAAHVIDRGLAPPSLLAVVKLCGFWSLLVIVGSY